MKYMFTALAVTWLFISPAKAQFTDPYSWELAHNGFGSVFSQFTGSPARVQLPALLVFDPLRGMMVSQFPFVTEFAVSVDPGSQRRGCQLVTDNTKYTGIVAQGAIRPTVFEGENADPRSHRQNWKFYTFSVNGLQGANVMAIQTTFWKTRFQTNCQYEILTKAFSGIGNPVPLAIDKDVVATPETEIVNAKPPVAFAAAAAPTPRGVEKTDPKDHEGNVLTDKIDISKMKVH